MTTTWILTANASEAHLFSAPKAKLLNGNNSLSHIKDFEHPQSRQKGADLVSDRRGNYSGKHAGHGSMVEQSEARQTEADNFAKELARDLELARKRNAFQDLIIIAPPNFHGRLNEQFSSQTSHLVSVDIQKDYTHDNEKQLLKHMAEYL